MKNQNQKVEIDEIARVPGDPGLLKIRDWNFRKKGQFFGKNRAILAGNKTSDLILLEKTIDNCPFKIDEIVSGGKLPANDSIIEFALDSGIPLKTINMDYHRWGRLAVRICTEEIVHYATHLILIWDGKCRDSRLVRNYAKFYSLTIHELRTDLIAQSCSHVADSRSPKLNCKVALDKSE